MPSLLHQRWQVQNQDLTKPLAERLFINRSILAEKQESFLSPDFERDLHDPYEMSGMKEAVVRIKEAVGSKEKILIFGDYDTDGVTAAALLYQLFEKIGAKTEVYLPHRVEDGYGLSDDLIEKFGQQGVSLLVTVDCGISNASEVIKAKKQGMEVIVTDHHSVPDDLPDTIVINPRQNACRYPFKKLAGVGVAFKLAWALAYEFLPKEEAEYFIKWNMDLVALGTIADVTPLAGENRTLVAYGLQVLNRTKKLGLKKLLEVAEKKGVSDEVTVGFAIAPRLNAAGRIGGPQIAFDLLVTRDDKKAEELARKLDGLNKKRQQMVEEAIQEADEMLDTSQGILLLRKDHWHQGILGLIAGKLTERYHRPVLAVGHSKEGLVGSARSPLYFNIIEAIRRHADLFIHHGGHSQAAGFSLLEKNWAALQKVMKKEAKVIKEKDLQAVLTLDTEIKPDEITLKNAKDLARFAPFGPENEEILFLLKRAKLLGCQQVGPEGKHLSLSFQVGEQTYRGIAFRMGEYSSRLQREKLYDLAAKLQINEWQSKEKVEMQVIDLREAV